ncbi:unnamed protein product [Phytomonas sp. EM1]|nr:unnamed protein product [Phytomonas sp. EM1]|eukprot:CCW62970.1 unnamed protein product [Phytomonas sp. isolate EM1]
MSQSLDPKGNESSSHSISTIGHSTATRRPSLAIGLGALLDGSRTNSVLLQQLLPVLQERGNLEDGADHTRRAPLFIDVDGPIDPEDSLIVFDTPYAPESPPQSLKLRKRLGLSPTESHPVDPNVRVILDSFITPRRWRDAVTGTIWVQHASPYPSNRIETMNVHEAFHAKLKALNVRRTGTSPARTALTAECFLEVIRQVVTESWERGLLLLHVYAERVGSQAAYREMFESRVGHAFRLALRGEKSASLTQQDKTRLQNRIKELERKEQELKEGCEAFAKSSEEELLIEEKKHNDAMVALKREYVRKKNQLEHMLVVPSL